VRSIVSPARRALQPPTAARAAERGVRGARPGHDCRARGNRVLEIGFGLRRSIDAASMLTHGGLVAGVDFSPSMFNMARQRNSALLTGGSLISGKETVCVHLLRTIRSTEHGPSTLCTSGKSQSPT
jgi:hypothetical protein